jgi:hypothetical protein
MQPKPQEPGRVIKMELEEIKATIQSLSAQDRRRIALYILELEKEHVSKTVGPQIAKDVEDVSKVVQEAVEKLKKFVNKG